MNLKWLWNGWCCAALWFAWPLLLATALVNSSYGAKMAREQRAPTSPGMPYVPVATQADALLWQGMYLTAQNAIEKKRKAN